MRPATRMFCNKPDCWLALDALHGFGQFLLAKTEFGFLLCNMHL